MHICLCLLWERKRELEGTRANTKRFCERGHKGKYQTFLWKRATRFCEKAMHKMVGSPSKGATSKQVQAHGEGRHKDHYKHDIVERLRGCHLFWAHQVKFSNFFAIQKNYKERWCGETIGGKKRMSSPLSHASPKPLGGLPATIVVIFHFFRKFFEWVKTYLGAQLEQEIIYIYIYIYIYIQINIILG